MNFNLPLLGAGLVAAALSSAARPTGDLLSAAISRGQPGVTIVSPKEYQVFQRRTRTDGQVRISGRVNCDCDSAQVLISGKPLAGKLNARWKTISLDPATRAFNVTLSVPAGGWYKLEVRALKDGKTVGTAIVEHFGVGEVFVGAGQSNSTNCGGEGSLKTETRMVSTFDGSGWGLADDPQPGCHDNSTGGSFWPAFGDAMYEKYRVPIGVAVTGHGGSTVTQWEPGGELFNWMMGRIWQLGTQGFRALLWHQGESDVGMSNEEYARRLAEVIRTSRLTAGWEFPWVVARVSYRSPAEPMFPSPRGAQKALWDARIALEGPDTDVLKAEYRDEGTAGIHFNPKGLRAHGGMWADRVGGYLDTALGK